MPKVAVLAKMTAKEGQGGALVKVMQDKMSAAVDSEAGTEVYSLYQDASNEDVVWVFELYTDQDALTAHSTSDAMKALGPELGPLLGGRPELMFLRPVSAKGLTF